MATLMTGATMTGTSLLTACSSDDNLTTTSEQQPAAAAKTYQVSIPASFEGDAAQTRAVSINGTSITAKFSTSEKVYAFNVTKDAVLTGYLQPTNISADGKSCQLTGTLEGTIEAEDELKLMYNINYISDNTDVDVYKDYTYFYYDVQDGTASKLLDGAIATATVQSTGGTTLSTTEKVSFTSLQSMFRFKFTDGSNPISVKSLTIESKKSSIAKSYYPFADYVYFSSNLIITPPSATTGYLYVAICIDESCSSGDVWTFTVTDASDNVYQGTKNAPSGGFKNGKYYYNSTAITLTKQDYVKPTIVWTSIDGTSIEPVNFSYSVDGPYVNYAFQPSEFTISGISCGYSFVTGQSSTIHLDNVGAKNDGLFIYVRGDLTLDIQGTNTITDIGWSQTIFAEGTLKLKGNGTLTVTCNDPNRYGLYASTNYNDDNNNDASVLAALAATGYAVTRSDMTNNGDRTYTWTYTVAPTASN